jgi:hypothetical protein
MGRSKAIPVMIVAALVGASVSSTPASAAFGFCSQPFAPTAFLTRPSKPFCASMRNCTEFDVQQYRNEIDRYYTDLKRYATQVNDYYDAATAYVKCMADLDRPRTTSSLTTSSLSKRSMNGATRSACCKPRVPTSGQTSKWRFAPFVSTAPKS